jgi:hypothetical protein
VWDWSTEGGVCLWRRLGLIGYVLWVSEGDAVRCLVVGFGARWVAYV